MTPAQRQALNHARRKGGCPADTIHPTTRELLLASQLITEHDHQNNGTWTLLITRAGTKAIHDHDHPPIREKHRKDTPQLFRGAWMPHPDPTKRRNVPELEIVPPTNAYVTAAREQSLIARRSFQHDLEAERARRKAERGRNMRNAA
jgi:hypothetical protein